MDGIIGIIFVALIIINLVLYHKLFRVVYFDLGKGLIGELIGAGFVACIEVGIVMWLGQGLLGIAKGVFSFVFSIVKVFGIIAIAVAIIVLVVTGIKKIMNKDAKEEPIDGENITSMNDME